MVPCRFYTMAAALVPRYWALHSTYRLLKFSREKKEDFPNSAEEIPCMFEL